MTERIEDRNGKKQWKMTKDKIERKETSNDEEEIEEKGKEHERMRKS